MVAGRIISPAWLTKAKCGPPPIGQGALPAGRSGFVSKEEEEGCSPGLGWDLAASVSLPLLSVAPPLPLGPPLHFMAELDTLLTADVSSISPGTMKSTVERSRKLEFELLSQASSPPPPPPPAALRPRPVTAPRMPPPPPSLPPSPNLPAALSLL